jgi:uncharacterized protein YbaP (TraB family)
LEDHKFTKQKRVLLLGTYHLFGNSFVDSFSLIKEKLNASDIIITGVKFDRPKVYAYYNSRPASIGLSSALPQEDINYISTIFKNGEVDISKYTPGELFVKLQAVYPKFKCSVINASDKWAMDEYIQRLGDQQQKTLYFLESDSLQLEKLYQATKAYDWNFFKKAVPGLLAKYKSETPDEALCFLANQYASFTMDYQLQEECKGSNMTDALVKKRNEDWMQKLPALLEKNNCFIAVGLMHLYNKCGLIDQLRLIGYSVEAVSMK